jgi:bacterioferritin-associated ferredoxin
LESLEKTCFSFAREHGLYYRWLYHLSEGRLVLMIVCSCNVISDHDIREAVEAADELPRNPKQVYGCLGCSPVCGRCARTIKTILDETVGPCAKVDKIGCRHNHQQVSIAPEQDDIESRFALAAC